MNNKLMRAVARLLVVSMMIMGLPLQPAQAAIIGTDVAQRSAQIEDARAKVEAFLERAEVANQLQQMGVAADQAKMRANALTDEEILQVAGKIDQLPAGGVEWLGVILVVLVVLIITDLLGWTKIFPFTRAR